MLLLINSLNTLFTKQNIQLLLQSTMLAVSLVFTISLVVITVMPDMAHAASFIQCGNDQGGKAGEGDSCTIGELFATAARIIQYLFGAAGVIAVAGVIFGGFQMAMSAGNEGLVQSGTKTITNSLIGLIIVLLAVLIVQTLLSFFNLQGGDPVSDPSGFIGGQ